MVDKFLWPIWEEYDIGGMWLQQEDAKLYTVKETKAPLKEKFPGRISWTITVKSDGSCDMTPLHCLICDVNRPVHYTTTQSAAQ